MVSTGRVLDVAVYFPYAVAQISSRGQDSSACSVLERRQRASVDVPILRSQVTDEKL